MRTFFSLLIVAGLWWSVSSCKKDSEVTTPQTNQNPTINQWIYEQMSSYYLWEDKMPKQAATNTSLNPEDYFSSLLYTYSATTNPQGDRFSFLSDDATALEGELNGESVTTGMQFRLFYRDNSNTSIAGQVLYVLKGSPADLAGFKRGDLFTRVNGQALTASNYSSLLFGTTTTFTFTLGTVTGNSIDDSSVTRSVTAKSFQEDPVFLDSVYTVNSKKIGYLVYNQFISSPNSNSTSGEYDNHLRAIFGKFKSAGVSQLVLDLRYNPGGSGTTAINLASLIVKYTGTKQVFYKEEYNSALNQYIQSRYGTDSFNSYFAQEGNNIGNQLSKVTILTSGWTASASELIINGLKPYMTVNLIGETTYGKNVGSTTLTDDTGKIKYALQPIIVKVYNSVGQSDYTAGFLPNIVVSEPLVLQALGSTAEPMLKTALLGAVMGGRAEAGPSTVGSSLERKGIFGKLIMTEKNTLLKTFSKEKTAKNIN